MVKSITVFTLTDWKRLVKTKIAILVVASLAVIVGVPIVLALSTVVSNIHNAPGWQHSHTYTYATGPFTRVNNGLGWNEAAGAYKPGQVLNAYELISGTVTAPGSCTSAPSGGPSGTGSTITDGTCTWKYLSPVDYISVAGWAFDNPAWVTGTLYTHRSWVTSDLPLRAYQLISDNCTSTIAPTGIEWTGSVLSDGCQWRYHADITYTSKVSHMEPQSYANAAGYQSATTYNLSTNYEADLWNDREYVAGQNGEVYPISSGDFHYGRDGSDSESLNIINPPAHWFHIIVRAAPGESFRDKLTSASALAGYDPTKGAAIQGGTASLRGPAGYNMGLYLGDVYMDVIGLQVKATLTSGIDGSNSCDHTVRNSIIEGNGIAVQLNCGQAILENSLVLSTGQLGVWCKYPCSILHSTLINTVPTANSVGIESLWLAFYPGWTISNTAVFGFAHAACNGGGLSWINSSNNITDNSATDLGIVTTDYGACTIDPLPGATYGASFANSFVSSSGDWRLPSGSPLRGAGSAFGNVTTGCIIADGLTTCPNLATYNFDSPDIIGTARPQSDGYDIGAWQSSDGTPPPTPPSPPVDTTAPVITLTGSATINLVVGSAYTELGATATDNVDGTDPVTIAGAVITSTPGTYKVTYDAVDAAGNHAIQVIRTVNVAAVPSPPPPPPPPPPTPVGKWIACPVGSRWMFVTPAMCTP